MKTLDYAEASIGKKLRKPRTPSALPKRVNARPAPEGVLPDARGWDIYPCTNEDRPRVSHLARAFYPAYERWITRTSFHSEAEAREFIDAENARNPAWHGHKKVLSAAAEATKARAEKLLTSAELAKRLRITPDGLDHQRSRGLPFIKLARNVFVYRWSEVLAFLESRRRVARRVSVELPPHVFSVNANPDPARPDRRFRVEGTPNGKRFQKCFRLEADAVKFARAMNIAHGRVPNAPMPAVVRGMKPDGPFWRVFPLNCPSTPKHKFEARAKVDGRWVSKRFMTQRDALECANELNFEALKAHFAEQPHQAAPVALETPVPAAPPQWDVPPAHAPLTPDEGATMRPDPFRIYPCKDRKPYSHYVNVWIGGKRRRKFFRNEAQAKTYAHLRNTEAKAQGMEAVEFPSWLRTMAQRCQEQLAPKNLCIDDATKFLLEHLERTARSCPLGKLAADLVDAKKRAGVSKPYLKTLEVATQRFAAYAGEETAASEIAPQLVREYLAKLPSALSPSSRNATLRKLTTLFAFAKENGYCADNPALKVEFAKVVDSPVGIVTPDQLAALLVNVPSEFVPFVAIGAFAGLRGSELRKLDWSEVYLNEGLIEVTAAKSKTSARRLVKIQPALDAWIRPHAQASGPVYPLKHFFPKKIFGAAMAKAGLSDWPRNALRHSFASYHIAHFHDASVLACEMGHTGNLLIFKHYRQVVRPAQAERYWQIMPPNQPEAGKLVTFSPSAVVNA